VKGTAIFLLTLCVPFTARAEEWPCWRGPRGDGTSLEKKVPVRWNGPEYRNVAWKVEIPGKGHASPIVFGDRIFLASCREETGDRLLLCLDRQSGRILWDRTVVQSRLENKHRLNSYAFPISTSWASGRTARAT
jgi:hypothetical protein